MDKKIVYDFLKGLVQGESAIGLMMQCIENKRNGEWDDKTFNDVKIGLRLWWFNKFEFYRYLESLRGLAWAA